MNAMTNIAPTAHAHPTAKPFGIGDDPLDADGVDDRVVFATSRSLTRLALVATEAGARFQREGEGIDPMSWMLTPRRLFRGGTAMEACLHREDFMRALLLHGLALGLDADPDEIDDLLADDDAVVAEGVNGRRVPPDRRGGRARDRGSLDERSCPRLYTATIVHEDEHGVFHAFHASIREDAEECARRLRLRFGPVAAAKAQIVAGFDPTTTAAEAWVAPALMELLGLIDADPCGVLATGFELTLEQRFAA